ncbi:hypothetical protein B1H29_04270 [Streptomyces pactum]|uniref:Transposase IS4-like domain-containing protein n=1 Tax=Streptomyces pactum TaxID=68249 RepID=A0A1S6J3C4_9ACTN|nr:hypothetical protein B1H29_04270 [Streptomyces pactum]
MIAVDGKTLGGSRTTKQPATALLATMTRCGQVLAQRQIYGKSNETPAFAPLLDGIDLTGAVATADALHTQHHHAAYLHERGAHYLAGGGRLGVASVACSVPRGGTTPVWRPSWRPRSPT